MKKIVCIAIVLGLCFLTTPAMAITYKADVNQVIAKILQDFYQQEQGNRLTIYSMRGLLQEINRGFQENMVLPEKPIMPKVDKKDDAPDK